MKKKSVEGSVIGFNEEANTIICKLYLSNGQTPYVELPDAIFETTATLGMPIVLSESVDADSGIRSFIVKKGEVRHTPEDIERLEYLKRLTSES